jgi:1,4-alpha-glucan branching enzyme
MLEKKPLGARKVEVTFRMPPLDGVVELNLCGDFNGWRVEGEPLRQESDGSWSARLVLEAGKSYRFRYFDNQGRWHNDWDADSYVPNTFGTEDSVVDLALAIAGPPEKAVAAKEPASKRPAEAPARKAAVKTPPRRRTKGAK